MDVTRHVLKREDDAAADAAAQAEFNEKKWVWVPDETEGYLPGWITKETSIKTSSSVAGKPSSLDADYVSKPDREGVTMEDVIAEVVLSSGQVRELSTYQLSKMNPPKFDRVDDIADLTFLNEASVVHNLKLRFGAGSIYTYSGLFLISLNPYTSLPIYTPQIVASYRNKRREECAPHIFATAERAWVQMGEQRESQSILITGESGAGKTENTKKVIQYLAAIASRSASLTHPARAKQGSSSSSSRASDFGSPTKESVAPRFGLPRDLSFRGKNELELSRQKELGLLEKQILQANPILEAFGNAQTMRNNNSSRFGKFIRIMFDGSGAISGANIDWYLLEKSRVTARAEKERSFHVFYQLLASGRKGADIRKDLLLSEKPEEYGYLKKSRTTISGVDDGEEWRALQTAFSTVGFTDSEQMDILRVVAAILHIGNIQILGDGGGQARIGDLKQLEKVAHLLGASVTDLQKAILRPTAKAGKEVVVQARSKEQADDELASLCKTLYERTFGSIVDRINKALDQQDSQSLFVGVLDIAGFEIFDVNGYEQLLINYTNERLQQFFNHHMFVLEQEEYSREGIQWEFVNFGLDLQPTIDLIESAQPIGILATLDEECIMPKASDKTFLDKLVANVGGGESSRNTTGQGRFHQTKFGRGFVVKHYAGAVEYDTADWLRKNKDPLNDNMTSVLGSSRHSFIASLFPDETAVSGGRSTKMVKRGAFRTVAQRHKEQLFALVNQLQATQPHFVRCIVPNPDKKPGRVDLPMVLHQLRCNGVLEGIRIARLGYPNRLPFAEFRSRYEVLTPDVVPKGFIDGRKACTKMVDALKLSPESHKLGLTKIFFKAGVLAELEEKRDAHLYNLFARLQSVARKHMARRKLKKLLNRTEAIKTIQQNARSYADLRDWPWWQLYVRMRPLVEAKRQDEAVSERAAAAVLAKQKADLEAQEKERAAALQAKHEEDLKKLGEGLAAERRLVEDRELQLAQHKTAEHELQEEVQALESERRALQQRVDQQAGETERYKEQLDETRRELAGRLQEALSRSQQDGVWQRKAAELSEKLLAASQTLVHAQEEKDAAHAELLEANSKINRSESEASKWKREAQEAEARHRSDMDAQRSRTATLEKDLLALKENLKSRQKETDSLSSAIAEHDHNMKRKDAQIAELQLKASVAEKTAADTAQSMKANLGLLGDAKRAAEDAVRDKSRKASALDSAQKELDGLRKLMAAKQSEAAQRASAEQSMADELVAARRKLEESESARKVAADQLSKQIRQLEGDLQATRSEHSSTKLALDRAVSEHSVGKDKLTRLEDDLLKSEGVRRGLESEVSDMSDRLLKNGVELETALQSLKAAEKHLQSSQRKINDFEDVVLTFEREKGEWTRRVESQKSDLQAARAKSQELESAALAQDSIIVNIRAQTQKLVAAIKARDDEIALLQSRQNKTVVEHVHVLEKAKRVTDRELAQTQDERDKLAAVARSLEQQKARLVGDLEDANRQLEIARSRQPTPTAPQPDPQVLNQERAARRRAEEKALRLETHIRDLARKVDGSQAEIAQLTEQLASAKTSSSQRLLQELHLNNQKLQQQMSDELNRSRTTSNRSSVPDLAARMQKRSMQEDDAGSKTHSRAQSTNVVTGHLRALESRSNAAPAPRSDAPLRTDRSASGGTKSGSPTDTSLDRQIEEAQSLFAGSNARSTAAIRNLIAQEIERERQQYARDLLLWENTINNTRDKYQEELARITQELSVGRDELSKYRQREHAQKTVEEDLRMQLSEEQHDNSGWKKEKQRLERRLLDLTEALENTSGKSSEVQAQQVLYINQIRDLREKLQGLEADCVTLREAKQRAEERAKQLLDEELKASKLSQDKVTYQLSARNHELELTIQELNDKANLYKERQARSDAHASECTQELSKIRKLNADLDRRNSLLEKELKSVQVRLVDLETRSYSNSPRTIRTGKQPL